MAGTAVRGCRVAGVVIPIDSRGVTGRRVGFLDADVDLLDRRVVAVHLGRVDLRRVGARHRGRRVPFVIDDATGEDAVEPGRAAHGAVVDASVRRSDRGDLVGDLLHRLEAEIT